MLLFVGSLTSGQYASVSQERTYSNNCTFCHTEIEVADQSSCLPQSQDTDTEPTSPGACPTSLYTDTEPTSPGSCPTSLYTGTEPTSPGSCPTSLYTDTEPASPGSWPASSYTARRATKHLDSTVQHCCLLSLLVSWSLSVPAAGKVWFRDIDCCRADQSK